MKIKRYTAPSMRAALAQVRAEQGEEAVILSSRRAEEGIEVIAAVDYDEGLFMDMNRTRLLSAAPEPRRDDRESAGLGGGERAEPAAARTGGAPGRPATTGARSDLGEPPSARPPGRREAAVSSRAPGERGDRSPAPREGKRREPPRLVDEHDDTRFPQTARRAPSPSAEWPERPHRERAPSFATTFREANLTENFEARVMWSRSGMTAPVVPPPRHGMTAPVVQPSRAPASPPGQGPRAGVESPRGQGAGESGFRGREPGGAPRPVREAIDPQGPHRAADAPPARAGANGDARERADRSSAVSVRPPAAAPTLPLPPLPTRFASTSPVAAAASTARPAPSPSSPSRSIPAKAAAPPPQAAARAAAASPISAPAPAGASPRPAVFAGPPAGALAAAADPGFAAMQRELGDLKRMLQSGLADMTWHDKRLREPLRAQVLEELSALDISPDVAMALANRAPRRTASGDVSRIPLALLVKHLPVADDPSAMEQGGIIALVGPTGAGKTTTIAKLAARCALRHGGGQVALISTDAYRIGARDQLMTYARILDTPMHAANGGRELLRLVERLSSKRLVLIDTAGMGARDVRLAEQLAALKLGAASAQVLLTLPAQGEANTLDEIVRAYKPAAPVGCILTKVDEAASLGAVLSATLRHGLKITYVCDGQRVPDDMHLAHLRRVWLAKAALKLKQGRRLIHDPKYLARHFGGARAHA